MTHFDDVRKRRQRAAYDDYVRLQWEFYRLAYDHPARVVLAEAVREAEQHWRWLMQTLGTADVAPSRETFVTPVRDALFGLDERVAAH